MIVVTTGYQPESLERLLPDSLPGSWRLDKTGRQMLTRQTIHALQHWMESSQAGLPATDDPLLAVRVATILGRVTTLRIRYVRLLLSALSGEWKSMKVLRQGLPDKGLVQRVYDLDPYGYTYRSDLHQILQGIGRLTETGR